MNAASCQINSTAQIRRNRTTKPNKPDRSWGNSRSGPPSCATASTKRSWSSCVQRNRCFEARLALLRLLPPLIGSIVLATQSKCWPWTNELFPTKLELWTLFCWYICHLSKQKKSRSCQEDKGGKIKTFNI